MTRQLRDILVVQLLFFGGYAIAWFAAPNESVQALHAAVSSSPPPPIVAVERSTPLRIEPLYDDVEVVSDDELAAVLKQIRPRFADAQIKPNFVEHAIRAWGVDAEFQDPSIMSGRDMLEFLTDHGRFLASWGADIDPLLVDRPGGVSIRWGREAGGSVHHDHWLACLTEAGATLNQPIYTPTRRDMTIRDALQEALRDFQLDERETEWSSMAFGFWLAPETTSWRNGEGRRLSFDLLAERLIRGDKRYGVCHGTHRVYSLMVLARLNEQFEGRVLSEEVHQRVMDQLRRVRDLIMVSQFDDGHWPSNWSEGKQAVDDPKNDEEYRNVIATGHHLEWLAIAPKELHPPREMILKAADWIIAKATNASHEEILTSFTFYSHVGNALALWRGTRPADFWRDWQTTHPFEHDER